MTRVLSPSRSPLPEGISELPPIPLSLSTDSLPDSEPDPTPQLPLLYTLVTSSIPLLTSIQKYSSISFTVFSTIHGAGVLLTPAFSPTLAEELISIGRTIYQAPGIEEVLVWGSLGLHVLSGITIRLIRGWTYRRRHDEGRRSHRARQNRQSSMVGPETMEVDYEGNVKVKNDSGGLTGGVGGYVGVGAKKSFVFRMTGLSPLQFSGYLSIPLVGLHVLQTRLIPMWVDGDSSYVTLEYVAYFFSGARGMVTPVLNWVVYPSMILITTYHTIYGLLTWMRVKDLRVRRIAVNVISLVSLWGMWSLYVVTKLDSSLPGFMTKRFDKYLDALYLRC